MNITVTPKAEKVEAGWQTIVGYASSASAVVAFALSQATAWNLPSSVELGLLVIAAALAGITGKNRSDQKVANTEAAGAAAAAALVPVSVTDLATGAAIPAHVALDVLPAPDEVR